MRGSNITGPPLGRDAALEIPEETMQAIMSHKGLGTAGYALIALPVALLISIYFLAYFVIADRFDVPNSCRLVPYLQYAVPRG